MTRLTKATVRTIFVMALTLVAIASEASDLWLPWHPYGSFGILLGPRSTVVVTDPRIARSLRPGDTVDLSRMTPADRFVLSRVVEPGRAIRLPLTSGRIVTITAQTLERSVADNISDVVAVLAMLAYLVLAAALVLLRPTPATWAFYVFSLPFCVFAAMPNLLPFAEAFPGAALLGLAGALSPGAFVAFALRFPDVQLCDATRRLEQFMLFVLTPLLAAFAAFDLFGYVFGGWVSPPGLSAAADVFRAAGYAVGVAALIVRYFAAKTDERNRLQWMLCAFAIAYLPFVAITFSWTRGIVASSPTIINLCQACAVLAPIALAYTVLKHRLFDIRLVVSRALMYAAMMSLVVGALALVDWAFSRWLQQSRFATLLELALALLLGVVLTTLHRRIELLLNRVIFRAQALALAGLRRFAHETDLIADPQRLLSQTHDALSSRIECEYVAMYTADGGSYALSSPRDPGLPAILAGDDFAVLRVRRWSEPFECDEPSHVLRGGLFVPMSARAQLVGFIVCGPKRDRTHYLPEEVETLAMLSHRVASSYAWLTMVSTAPLLASPSFDSPA